MCEIFTPQFYHITWECCHKHGICSLVGIILRMHNLVAMVMEYYAFRFLFMQETALMLRDIIHEDDHVATILCLGKWRRKKSE